MVNEVVYKVVNRVVYKVVNKVVNRVVVGIQPYTTNYSRFYRWIA